MEQAADRQRTHGLLRPLATVAAIYVLPVVLLVTGAIPFRWRFHVLLTMTLLAGGLAVSRHSAASLGLTAPKLRPLLWWALLPALALGGFIYLADLPHRRLLHRHPAPGHIAFYVFFVLISAPAQEFLYRSFLFAELRQIRIPPAGIVLLSALLFGFMHIIYRDPLTVFLTLGAGLVWGLIFHSTRRAGIVAASHAALGVVAILAGLV